MTTVVDPSGTPAPVYNRSGATIVEVAAGSISPTNSPTPIPRLTGMTIALCTSTSVSNAIGVALPLDADIGDLVEVHALNNDGLLIMVQSGETMHGASNGSEGCSGSSSRVFRKVSATNWRKVGA